MLDRFLLDFRTKPDWAGCHRWSLTAFSWTLLQSLLTLAVLNVVVAGASLRIGGQLAKGPYLPQTLEGLSKTTRAVMGR
ncbi:hypothetical protein Syn8016DRAFT_1142 [Synechococcus sp. WH 8016]|nr:hypothetical protein Syn8016DRAFT_1142 [Synechococcus sp. WH 8016]